MEKDNAQIGKDVIESLTLGMYEDCRFIYREYIQNSADQIDKAKIMGILSNSEDEIHVVIDPYERRIVIEDNATGIEAEKVVPVLRNIAHSTKKRGEDKGFRGIGRLGGLGYCSKLHFETSYKGEPIKSVMTWDAELLKFIINDRDTKEEAVDVLMRVTNSQVYKENADKHYFKVILEDVTSDDLLDVDGVREYLSMVAPVDIDSRFMFRNNINIFMREHGLSVDTYNIYVNGEQIYKPYTNYIYEDNNGGKKKVDEILDVKFLLQTDEKNEIMYWGWYTLSQLNGQMKPKNIARGIRLRKENIQIGDEEICKKFFSKTEDQRFSFYYFGEIHAVSKGLIPNSRRDYFGESRECMEFERRIKADFLQLKEICYDVQRLRSSAKTITKTEELRAKIQEKNKNGYTSPKERDDLQRQFEDYKSKAAQARKQLDNMTTRLNNSDSPLRDILGHLAPTNLPKEQETTNERQQIAQTPIRALYRTDNPIYSRFSRSEKKLIRQIYSSITNALPDEKQCEVLISKIEEDITR